MQCDVLWGCRACKIGVCVCVRPCSIKPMSFSSVQPTPGWCASSPSSWRTASPAQSLSHSVSLPRPQTLQSIHKKIKTREWMRWESCSPLRGKKMGERYRKGLEKAREKVQEESQDTVEKRCRGRIQWGEGENKSEWENKLVWGKRCWKNRRCKRRTPPTGELLYE